MNKSNLVIGSRGSQLALWQANWVKTELELRGHTVHIEIIKTTGDRITDVPLAKVGTKGLFTKEIEEALLAGRVHLAVHSLKDLPTELPAGLALGAVPRREDPRDALVCAEVPSPKSQVPSPTVSTWDLGPGTWDHAATRRLAELPVGARVGTSSLRRSAQLLHARPDLQIDPLRGNLDTRLRKLDEGNLAAIVLAAAGLHRMGWAARITEYFPPEIMCPAAGQGALGVEVRAGDAATLEALAPLDDPAARLETAAERALLARLGGGCQVPIGALARFRRDGRLLMSAVVASPDGRRLFRASGEGLEPEELGARLAGQLLRDGAAQVLAEVYGSMAPLPESP